MSNFFNLLTRKLDGKLKSLPTLHQIYKIYPKATKFAIESLHTSQLTSELINLTN